MKKKNKIEKVFMVTVEWANDHVDNYYDVYLFTTIEKAIRKLRDESLDELKCRVGNIIFYDDEDEVTESIIKDLSKEFTEEFAIVDDEEESDYVISATQTSFSCYKQGEYFCDHINVCIQEKEVN